MYILGDSQGQIMGPRGAPLDPPPLPLPVFDGQKRPLPHPVDFASACVSILDELLTVSAHFFPLSGVGSMCATPGNRRWFISILNPSHESLQKPTAVSAEFKRVLTKRKC